MNLLPPLNKKAAIMNLGLRCVHAKSLAIAVFAAVWIVVNASGLFAQERAKGDAATGASDANGADVESRPAAKLPEPKGAKRLSPDFDAWIDPKEKAVLIDGQISLREGMLEMFACTRNTKEHESVVSANTKAYLVHAALLRLGAEPGTPVQ